MKTDRNVWRPGACLHLLADVIYSAQHHNGVAEPARLSIEDEVFHHIKRAVREDPAPPIRIGTRANRLLDEHASMPAAETVQVDVHQLAGGSEGDHLANRWMGSDA